MDPPCLITSLIFEISSVFTSSLCPSEGRCITYAKICQRIPSGYFEPWMEAIHVVPTSPRGVFLGNHWFLLAIQNSPQVGLVTGVWRKGIVRWGRVGVSCLVGPRPTTYKQPLSTLCSDLYRVSEKYISYTPVYNLIKLALDLISYA